MSGKVRIVLVLTLAKGTTLADVCELAESLPAVLEENREVKRADVIEIKRVRR